VSFMYHSQHLEACTVTTEGAVVTDSTGARFRDPYSPSLKIILGRNLFSHGQIRRSWLPSHSPSLLHIGVKLHPGWCPRPPSRKLLRFVSVAYTTIHIVCVHTRLTHV